jgi:hypothetical protein
MITDRTALSATPHPYGPLPRHTPTAIDTIRHHDRLDGPIHEYQHVA